MEKQFARAAAKHAAGNVQASENVQDSDMDAASAPSSESGNAGAGSDSADPPSEQS